MKLALTNFAGGGASLSWTNASIFAQTSKSLDVVFESALGDFHWVVHSNLAGAYQYFVNKALPVLGEFRTLSRLDNVTFPRGRNSEVDAVLPSLALIANSTNVQDETWLSPDGSYITKYDFATFNRKESAYGVYGPKFGCWYIFPGKDDYNGDHLKQELTFHRETRTGDVVLLNMLHGTHFQVSSSDSFDVGKSWGPWLWYLNDGNFEDAALRSKEEDSAYPYKWFNESSYQSRGSVSGALTLSDGRPASGAAVFLGDNNSNLSTLDQGKNHYYTTYANARGKFKFEKVRSGFYGLQAWSNGAPMGDVSTTFVQNYIVVSGGKETELKQLTWKTQGRKKIWQIGELDRKSSGFKFGGVLRQHGLVEQCPTNLRVVPGLRAASEWCYGQSAVGNWTVAFRVTGLNSTNSTSAPAILSVSLAGYSSSTSSNVLVNNEIVGTLRANDPGLLNDPSMYRSGNLAGEWRLLEFPVRAGLLKSGTNEVTFQVTKFARWRGFMWDSVILEWL